ncbi:MAG: ABC transporter permease [Burkholderiales bacterium]|nr:ABC transporter permease [Burkholderiales bacterium]
MRLLWAEWRHHPWRQAAAVLAVALGVALAFAVQLINASALSEFSAAVHAASGAPDFSVQPRDGPLAEDLYPRLAMAPGVAQASPVIDLPVTMRAADGQFHPAHLLGLDAFVAPWISPGWLVQPEEAGASGVAAPGAPLAALDPDRVFPNAAARALVGKAQRLTLRVDGRTHEFAIGGRIAADGPPLLVMDIAGAQTHFDRVGSLSRIDVRLAPGARQDAVMAALDAGPDVRAAAPDEAALRMARLSQSYRVNLSVLSLVALFTGAFLVFSVQSLAVAKRIPQLALLGVLGMDGRQRRALVWIDSLMVGVLGAAAGLALGTGLAAAALRALGGDLGSGTLGGSAPRLQWSVPAALAYGALGVASAFAGGWWPARAAQGIAPAQSLKGLSSAAGADWPAAAGLGLILLAALLAMVPPWHAIPWGAYACVAVLLLGGISLVPQVVALLLEGFRGARNPVAALAVARAVDQRHTATAAVAGVVASLSLVVALTVMVGSFRDSLVAWLDDVLPADIYVRQVPGASDTQPFLPPAVVAAASGPGVRQLRAERLVPVMLAPDQPEAALLVRDLLPGETQPQLPWVVAPDDAPPASTALLSVYPTEVLAALQHLKKGDVISLPLPPPRGASAAATSRTTSVRAVVRGIWRDYARQQGALLMSRADWLRLTGDERITALAIWLADDGGQRGASDTARTGAHTHGDAPAGASAGTGAAAGDAVVARIHAAVRPDTPTEVATAGELRAYSLRIFDRSFAVTRWLQGVALAIGLAGIAASFSAQVLARRREFGTLQHLGFTRRQVLALVASEGALWSAVGAVLGLALGLAVSVVLVKVVNPQSFHWTMQMSVPSGTLLLLGLGVVLAGALTAWGSGHAAASRDVVRAVKEDW